MYVLGIYQRMAGINFTEDIKAVGSKQSFFSAAGGVTLTQISWAYSPPDILFASP